MKAKDLKFSGYSARLTETRQEIDYRNLGLHKE